MELIIILKWLGIIIGAFLALGFGLLAWVILAIREMKKWEDDDDSTII